MCIVVLRDKVVRKQRITHSKFDRIDKSCALLRSWLNNTFERRGVTEPDDSHRRNQGLAYENLPDRSTCVTDFRLDHFPGLIEIFLDVKHCQRHSTGDPQRCLCDMKSRTCGKNDGTDDRYRNSFRLVMGRRNGDTHKSSCHTQRPFHEGLAQACLPRTVED